MDWTRVEVQEVSVFRTTARDGTRGEMEASAADAWRVLLEDVLPVHSPDEWNVVRIDAWPDSARVLLFPARSPFSERTDRALIEVTWPALRTAWDRFQNAPDDDPDLERRVTATVSSIFGAFQVAWSTAPHRVPSVECYEYEELRQRFPARPDAR